MSKDSGLVLVFLLVATLLLLLLGSALLSIALSDWRVTRHLAETEEARYAALAGVEWALTKLPRSAEEIASFKISENSPWPAFSVTVRPGGGMDSVIQSTGRAGGKTVDITVRASLQLLGGRAVIAGRARLANMEVHGHLSAGEAEFAYGRSYIFGDLCYGRKLTEGGSYFLTGAESGSRKGDFVEIDFAKLFEVALRDKWDILSPEGVIYLNDRLVTKPGSGIWVAGDAVIAAGAAFSGLVAVDGDLTIKALPRGDAVILAAGDITMSPGMGAPGQSGNYSHVIYGAESLSYEAAAKSRLRGVLMGKDITLSGFELIYCERAAAAVRQWLPLKLREEYAAFELEWVDPRPRR